MTLKKEAIHFAFVVAKTRGLIDVLTAYTLEESDGKFLTYLRDTDDSFAQVPSNVLMWRCDFFHHFWFFYSSNICVNDQINFGDVWCLTVYFSHDIMMVVGSFNDLEWTYSSFCKIICFSLNIINFIKFIVTLPDNICNYLWKYELKLFFFRFWMLCFAFCAHVKFVWVRCPKVNDITLRFLFDCGI